MRPFSRRVRAWIAARPLTAAAVLTAAGFVAAALAAQTSLSELWMRFPDGTVQTTAAHNCFNPADPDDEMIRVGGVCVDKYEASVWSSPIGGDVYGTSSDNYPCSDNGQDCFGKIYARSVQGHPPARFITWFQAQQALANSGKRLPTNAEWQMAVAGTPDDGNCNVSGGGVLPTGTHPNCVSNWGAFDMVGNVWEWVADWDEAGGGCTSWGPTFGQDNSCVGLGNEGPSPHLPGAFVRGGDRSNGVLAGAFAVIGGTRVDFTDDQRGFRGAR